MQKIDKYIMFIFNNIYSPYLSNQQKKKNKSTCNKIKYKKNYKNVYIVTIIGMYVSKIRLNTLL